MQGLFKTYTTLLCLLFLVGNVHGQKLQKEVEHLQEVYQSGDGASARALYPSILEKAEKKKEKEPELYADLLNTIGHIYFTFGSYDTAGAYYWNAMESIKPSKGVQSFEYNQYGYNLAYCFDAQGRFSEAEQWYLYTLPFLAEAYGAGSVSYTECFHNLAILYTEMGRYEEARPMSEAAVNFFGEISGKDDENYLLAHNNLGRIYQGLGRYQDAKEIFETSLEYHQKNKPNDEVTLSILMNNLAELYRSTGNYYGALPLYRDALKIALRHTDSDPAGPATLYNNMGLIYQAQGEFQLSEQSFLNAIALYKKLGMTEHPDYTNPLNNMGELYRGLGRTKQAVTLFNEVIAIRTRTTGETHPQYANALNNLALAYTDLGNWEEAEKLFLQCLEIYEAALGKEHNYYANCLNNLAALYGAAGKLEEAQSLLEEALETFKNTLGEDHERYAIYLSSLGEIESSLGMHESAISHIKKALGIVENRFGKTYAGYTDILVKLAEAYRAANQTEVAQSTYLETLEQQLVQIKAFFPVMSESERTDYYQTVNYRFQLFNSFVVDQAQRSKKDVGPLVAAMYDFQLSTKGILLNEITRTKSQILNSEDEKLRTTYSDWLLLKHKIMLVYSLSEEMRVTNGYNLEELQHKAGQMEVQLQTLSATFAKAHPAKATWKKIQEKLKPNEAAIEIIRLDYYKQGWQDSVVYLALSFIHNSPFPTMRILSNGKDLDSDALQHWKHHIMELEPDLQSYDRYWKSIRQHLPSSVSKVYLSVDGAYQQLNLNTLQNPKTKAYLIDELHIELMTSTRDVLQKSGPSWYGNKQAILVGNPSYDLGNPIQENGTTRTGIKNVPALPGTQIEIDAIAETLSKQNWKVLSISKENATEATLKNIHHPTVLHIATHGFFLEAKVRKSKKVLGMDAEQVFYNPMLRSGLMLAGVTAQNDPNNFEGEDGILTAFEATDLPLDSAELVVLSACETGLGDVVNGEGVYGLQRAFQVAGAKSIIMSLWSVADDPTQELMTDFYTLWTNHPEKNKQEAFRQAQLNLRKKYPEPYYWGAFILVGE